MPSPPAKKKKITGGDGRVGFCVRAAATDAAAALPTKGSEASMLEGKSSYIFVPALHVGVTAGGCGGTLRVSFARALLPEPTAPPDARDVPEGPAQGSQLRAAGATPHPPAQSQPVDPSG